MLRRLIPFLPRGSARIQFKIPINLFRLRTFSFSSSSPIYHRSAPSRKRYIFCAVGGIVALTSVRDDKEDMTPLDLPGRPGNLTDEQKVKLKEMWNIAFKVFGIPIDQTVIEAASTPEP